jgi:hypothetical protein
MKDILKEGTYQTNSVPNVHDKELENLDDDGVIKENIIYQPGSILIGLSKLKEKEELSGRERMLKSIYRGHTSFKDVSIRGGQEIYGIVREVKKEKEIIYIATEEYSPNEADKELFEEKSKIVLTEIEKKINHISRIKSVVGEKEHLQFEDVTEIINKVIKKEINIESGYPNLKRAIRYYLDYKANEEKNASFFKAVFFQIQNKYMKDYVKKNSE